MLGMVNILNIRDGAQKTNRTSTLQKHSDGHIFSVNPSLYNFPKANIPMIDSSLPEKRPGGDPYNRRREATKGKGHLTGSTYSRALNG